MLRPLLLTILLAVSRSPLAAQSTLTVPGQYATIQTAIVFAQNGDTVEVAPGTYVGGVNFIGKSITVRSSQGAAVTSLLGVGSQPIVSFVSGEQSSSILEGFNLSGGAGSGVLVSDSSPVIRDCRITGNMAAPGDGGGGIRCIATAGNTAGLFMLDTDVSNNLTDRSGGGLFCEAESNALCQVTIQGCTFSNNVATANQFVGLRGGGAVACYSPNSGAVMNVTMAGCTVFGNSSADRGGGLSFEASDVVTVSDCRIVGNITGAGNGSGGGGIYCTAAQGLIIGCLISDNSSGDSGGAMTLATHGNSPTVTVASCTIAGNVAPAAGGVSVLGPVVTTIQASILSGNTGSDLAGGFGYTALVTYSAVGSGFFPANPTNVSADPLFVDAANGDYHLASNSPCIDAGGGPAAGLPTEDMDGAPRIVNGTIDIGADEVPMAVLQGTAGDLDLYTHVGGSPDPHAAVVNAVPGDVMMARVASPSGSLVGYPAFLVGQIFTTGAPPPPNPAFPQIHISLQSPFAVILGSLPPTPFLTPGLPPQGIDAYITVPPGLTGLTARLQGFVATTTASNGQFESTRAHDIEFQ